MAMKREQSEAERRLCGVCGSSERWFLHYVRLRGSFRRLCTNCVLKNHPGLFCPICLEVFDHSPPPRERVMCLKCPSISHFPCVAANSSFNSFQCPPCSQPTFTFFNSNRHHDNNPKTLLVDRDSAKALVAAARIAAVSMTKAASTARLDAERRVKEAVSAKKRAKEALEQLASLVAKQKEKDSKAENLNAKPKSESPGGIQVLAKIASSLAAEPEGSNGLRLVPSVGANQLKITHADAMEED